jgi:hypothetical protein
MMNLQRLATIILRPVQPEIARAVMRKLSSFNAVVLVKRRKVFPTGSVMVNTGGRVCGAFK